MAVRQWRVSTACNVAKVDTASVHLCPTIATTGDAKANAESVICTMTTMMTVATENDAAAIVVADATK